MIKCKVCDCEIPESAIRCPNCKTPLNVGMISTSAGEFSLDRVVSARLARSLSSSLLEKADSSSSIANEIEKKTMTALTSSDLQSVVNHLQKKSNPDLGQIENMLDLNPGKVILEGISLAGLLDGKGDNIAVIKKGLVFLKHCKYAEATEWWTLNRQRIDSKQQKFQFVLLIMEAFTYSLAGDEVKTEQMRKKIHNHYLYGQYKK
jgi:hypothetical protein